MRALASWILLPTDRPTANTITDVQAIETRADIDSLTGVSPNSD